MSNGDNLPSDEPDGVTVPQPVDITRRQGGDEIEAAEVPIYTRLWAEVVKPLPSLSSHSWQQ